MRPIPVPDIAPTWNLIANFQEMWSFPFMVNAFRAGTIVAITAAVVGWFMVLRRQTFVGHTLSVVGFPGAAGAVLLGMSSSLGYFGFSLGAAMIIALVRRGGDRHESAVTGTVQAFALACGYFFVTLYKGSQNGITTLLFGTFLGITEQQVVVLIAVSLLVLGVLALIGRPLLFSSIDPSVAYAQHVPVRALSVVFLVLLGATVAEVSQITGTLLVFALLVIPAAAAQALTASPMPSLLTTVAIATTVIWVSLIVAYYSKYPVGYLVCTFAFACYALAQFARFCHGRRTIVTGHR